jgi:hypothetical protein
LNIVDSSVINVLNYSDSPISVPTQIRPEGYWFEPSRDGEPFVIPISFAEIRVANSQSEIFRNGRLRFEKEFEKDVYEKLGIYNWENILFTDDIKNIILNPTKEGLERLIKITNLSVFDKVRGLLISMKNTGKYDISQRVVDVINYRYQELYRNKKNSEIVIHKTQQEMVDEVRSKVIEEEIIKIREELEKKIRAEVEEEFKKKIDDGEVAKRGKSPKNQE